ncbi:unnamed protein product [Amaranthus hypochondriacus]
MATSVQNQVLVKGTFKNELASNVELMKIETYSGFFQDGGPNAIIEPGHETSFKHNGALPQGSKVGVAYRVPNGDLCVLAWHVPEPRDQKILMFNKVLGKDVKAGESIDWAQIEKELNEQQPAMSKVKTRYFEASITPDASKAELNMNFIPIIPRDN